MIAMELMIRSGPHSGRDVTAMEEQVMELEDVVIHLGSGPN